MFIYAPLAVLLVIGVTGYGLVYLIKTYLKTTKTAYDDIETVDENGNTIITVKEVK